MQHPVLEQHSLTADNSVIKMYLLNQSNLLVIIQTYQNHSTTSVVTMQPLSAEHSIITD